MLNKEHKTADAPTRLLGDVQRVFHEDSIFLNIDVPTFRKWVAAILLENNLSRIVYIFDEFSEFIDENRAHLKTFEDVTENPGINHFFLVPVTHLEITAFVAEGSENAQRSKDRFYRRKLQMPNDTAFRLAAHAMKPLADPETDPISVAEWKTEKDNLYSAISDIAGYFNTTDPSSEDYVSRQSFYDVLPIHPMAAFLLKFLSESTRSGQRSIFDYLKGSANGREFQDFIRTAGPSVANKQFLTVDYLWKYFIDREDLGINEEITSIRSEYERIKNREFSNQTNDATEIRVLKAVLLFCLLDRLNPDGHERLRPTVTNIELSFRGDGALVNVGEIVKDLAEDRHCFSVVNGHIELFATSVGGADLQKKIAEQENKFHDLLSPKVASMLEEHTKSTRASHSAHRFEIRVSDAIHTTLTNITSSVRDRYSVGLNKDNASVCLWFVIARNEKEQLEITEKIKSILSHLHDHRVLMFTFPTLSFCHNNVNLWNDYIRQYAQYLLENDGGAKTQIKNSYERLEREWFDEIKKQSTIIKMHSIQSGQVVSSDTYWSAFKQRISDYVRKTLPNCVDYLTQYISAFDIRGLKEWALSGIQFDNYAGKSKQLINIFKAQSITDDENWFAQNPKHPLSEIHALFEKKIANSIGKGGQLSVRRVYIELQRAPFGMRYNALSAFVLGFTLRNILTKNFQWTDGKLTRPLDADTLAEIIESVVKNDGNENMKGEKVICRLSKEDKAFIEKAPQMFGVSSIADATIEIVLGQIQNSIQDMSGRVPLWVLPEYIRSVSEEKADKIEEILNNVCIAFSTSSKGKTEERSNAVRDVGTAILECPDIVDVIADYIKSENFVTAFDLYIDKTNLALAELAKRIGDVSHGYSRAIREKASEAAGWLWKQADISKEVDEMFCEYEVIELAKPLLGFTDFIPYKHVFEALRSAIMQTNCLPKSMIVTAYPALSMFLSVLQQSGSVYDIKSALLQYSEIIAKLFFDSTKAEALEIVKKRLNGAEISNDELRDILGGMPSGFGLDEPTFLNGLRAKIEDNAKQSVVSKLKAEWLRLSSGVKTPFEWALSNGIPARFLLGGLPQSDDILKAIEQPETFAAAKLAELLDTLQEITPPSIVECQQAFLAETVPTRYAKFNISLASLLEFLREIYGKQPNFWSKQPDISEFIRSQYKGMLAPQVAEKIRNQSSDELKQKLLLLAQENAELGLLFWE